MISYGLLGTLEYAADFFLGFCTFIGAAFVFQRSKRAALFVALGGLSFALAIPIEYMFSYGSIPSLSQVMRHVLPVMAVARHVLFFGGITGALFTISKESAAR